MFEIFENVEYEVINKGKDFVIGDIHYDSRKIKENDVFCALIGAVTDGHNYIEKEDFHYENDISAKEETAF